MKTSLVLTFYVLIGRVPLGVFFILGFIMDYDCFNQSLYNVDNAHVQTLKTYTARNANWKFVVNDFPVG